MTISVVALDRLRHVEHDARLEAGARNVVQHCLGLGPGKSLVLVAEQTDAIEPIAEAYLREAEAVGATVHAYLVTEAHAGVESFVQRLRARLVDADASLLVCTLAGLPLSFRRAIAEAGGARRRHGHMVDASAGVMQQSLRADLRELHALGERLLARLRVGGALEVCTSTGTSLRVQLAPGAYWRHESGLLEGPGWVNLPPGEVGTTPVSVDGVVVPDAVWLDARGELSRAPRLRLGFEGGRLTAIEGRDADAIDALRSTVDADEQGRRVGHVGLGTNVSVLTPVGALLQDQKMPGVSITLGQPLTGSGAAWSSCVQVPVLIRRPDVSLDGSPILVRGRYVPAIAG
jgi:leucyl aminopeptidase (aminopeptidase T)